MTRKEADAAFNAAVERYQARCSAELKYTTWDRSTVAERGLFADTIAEAIQAAVAEERERWIRLAPWWTGRALQSPEDIRRLAIAARDKAWREWLTRGFSDEWISTATASRSRREKADG